MKFYKKYIAFIVVGLLISTSCNNSEYTFTELSSINESNVPVIAQEFISVPLINDAINFSHFNHLYKEIDFKEKKIGIVHIYSSYPNYNYDIEPNEGYTCVDDVARAIVMLSRYLELFDNDEVALEKLK